LTKDELSKIFWDGVNTDYSKLEATAEMVSAMLKAGKEVHITNANGTDLKFVSKTIPFLPVMVLFRLRILKGEYAASQVYLPAGEVLWQPFGTAEGTVGG
jgi:leucyl aminopeptidase (aminopeptidase T)